MPMPWTSRCLVAVVVLAGCSTGATTADSPTTPAAAPASTATTADTPGAEPVEVESPVEVAAVEVESPVDAAVRFAETKQAVAAAEDAVAVELVRGIAHPDGVDVLVDGLMNDLELRAEVAPAGLGVRVAVIETMVIADTGTTVTVALWTAQFVTGAGATRVTYNTLTLDIAVHDGEWRLVAETSTPGPVPTPVQDPSDPSAFEAALVGFADPDEGR